MLTNSARPGAKKPADDWYRVVAAIADQERKAPVDPNEVLASVRTESLAENSGHDSGVVVTTIHKAKGLEWKAVVVLDRGYQHIPEAPRPTAYCCTWD